MGRLTTILVVALVLLAIFAIVATPALANKPTCDRCMKSGYPYLCKATMQSGLCFQNAGDATCDGSGCTCCRKEAGAGCRSCDDLDEDEDDDMDDTD